MANQDRWCRAVSTKVAFLTLAGTRAKRILIVTGMLGVAFSCAAQEGAGGAAKAQDTQGNSPTVTSHGAVTIPAGTRFALVLTNPVASKSMRRGDEIYTQTIAPVLVGDQMVIPPGAFVQGKLEKLTRNGTRAQMHMQSASVVFPDSFVASVAGAIDIEGEEGTALPAAGGGNVAGAIAAPLAGLGEHIDWAR